MPGASNSPTKIICRAHILTYIMRPGAPRSRVSIVQLCKAHNRRPINKQNEWCRGPSVQPYIHAEKFYPTYDITHLTSSLTYFRHKSAFFLKSLVDVVNDTPFRHIQQGSGNTSKNLDFLQKRSRGLLNEKHLKPRLVPTKRNIVHNHNRKATQT